MKSHGRGIGPRMRVAWPVNCGRRSGLGRLTMPATVRGRDGHSRAGVILQIFPCSGPGCGRNWDGIRAWHGLCWWPSKKWENP